MKYSRELKMKKIILFFTIITFLTIFFVELKDNYVNYDTEKETILKDKKESFEINCGIKINSIDVPYDKDNNIYYFSINTYSQNPRMNFKLNCNNKNFIINNQKNNSDIKFNLSGENKILIWDDNNYFETKLIFSTLPIVNIYTDNSIEPVDNYINIDFQIIDGNYMTRTKSASYNYTDMGAIKIRGGTSRWLPKKSLRVTLSEKKSLLDMRKDEDWILDALYTDVSKIRNKFVSDFWNVVNNNQKINNDLNAEFVEVFINDSYMGLYTLKEPVDQKTVNIDENGVMIKNFSYKTNYLGAVPNHDYYINNYSSINFDNKVVLNYEMSYPKDFNQYKIFFKKINESLKISNMDEALEKTVHMDNLINYNLMIIMTLSVDNLEKNIIYSLKNSNDKFLLTPWDLDLSLGATWDGGSKTHSKLIPESYNEDSYLKKISYENANLYYSKLTEKYWELRETIYNEKSINNYLNYYKKILIESKATIRDANKWYEYDVENEIEYIKTWLLKRINYLDEYFGDKNE